MKRTLPQLRLSRTPLVLVLCQARVAKIQAMSDYIPKIQDRLRTGGFPIDVSGELQEFFGIQGGEPVARKRPHWEFRTKDERWSLVVGQGALVLQTTEYTDFETFLSRALRAFDVVNEIVGDLVVERVGLRYVDLIRSTGSLAWRDYLRPGLHGFESSILHEESATAFTQIGSSTGEGRRVIARVSQNRDGLIVPPDLATHLPASPIKVGDGELLTILDLDHYEEKRRDFSTDDLGTVAWDLHDGLDRLFRDIVTEDAIESWK